MKLEHNRGFERKLRPKSVEALRATPEMEQPLEIDLQRVVDEVAAYKLVGPYRSDYETLLGLLGGRYLEQLHPKHKEEATEKFSSQRRGEKGRPYELALDAQCKLFDPTAFAGRPWKGHEIRKSMNDELALMKIQEAQPWLVALELIVLFPEEKERIMSELRPEVDSRLGYIQRELNTDPAAVLWEDLVVIKTLFPEINSRVQAIARKQWPNWQRRMEGSLDRARTAESDKHKKTFGSAAVGLSIAMYILASEKTKMNDQGLLEITPAQKKVAASPTLPGRLVL